MVISFLPTSQNAKPIHSFLCVSGVLANGYFIGEHGEYIDSHPHFTNPRKLIVDGDDLYILGWTSSRYRHGRFTYLPIINGVIGGNLRGNKLITTGYDFLIVYDKRDLREINRHIDWSLLLALHNYNNGYYGRSVYTIAHVDENLNTINVIKAKGIPLDVYFDGQYFYTTEDMGFIRKYDLEGNLIAEIILPYSTDVVGAPDGNLWVASEKGITILDSNLNYKGSIVMPADLITFVDDKAYIYDAMPNKLSIIDVNTKSIISSKYMPFRLYNIRTTDTGDLIMTISDFAETLSCIKIYSTSLDELFSICSDEIPYIYGAVNSVKVVGKNKIITNSIYYAANFELDMDTRQLTNAYANFLGYDADYYGGHYAVALPFINSVYIYDEKLNLIKQIPLGMPTSVEYYKGKLYVADTYLDMVFVFDEGYNLINRFKVPGLKDTIFRFSRFKDGWYATDALYVLHVLDDNLRIVKSYDIYDLMGKLGIMSVIGEDRVFAFNKYKDNYVFAFELSSSLLFEGKAFYTYDGIVSHDKYSPSYTGGLLIQSPLGPIRAWRDYSVEGRLGIWARYVYPTPEGGYITSRIRYTETEVVSVIYEFDKDLNVVKRLTIPNMALFSAVKLADGNYVITDWIAYKVSKVDGNGNIIWSKDYVSANISPFSNFNGVWVSRQYDRVDYIRSDGTVGMFTTIPNTYITDVFDDGLYVYVADVDGNIRKYDMSGRLVKVISNVNVNLFGFPHLIGGVVKGWEPLHVKR